MHYDLLKQAQQLAKREPRRPKQASLRRAVSSAYYALFHLLVDEATKLMIGGKADRRPLRLTLRRAFVHAHMKDAARGFASGAVTNRLRPALSGSTIQPQLRNVAQAFLDLQQARHEADYDMLRTFARAEVLDLVVLAERSFADWKIVKSTLPADTFLIALLVQKTLKG
ncbi:MAG: hypothetical protein AAGJ10_02535 [Bacteroidota bacterium]